MTMVLRVTVPAIAAGLLLAGCGGSSGTTNAQSSPAATTSSAATPSAVATTAAAPTASATASTTSAVTQPPGSKLVVDKADGYQVALPANYVHITSKSQLAKVFKAGASSAARTGITEQLLNKSLKMIAVNPNSGQSINVVVASAGGLTSDQLPAVEPVLKKEVGKLGAKKVTFTKVTLGGEPALRAVYTANLSGRSVPTVQYITVHSDQAYTLTFSKPSSGISKIEKQTASSFQFI